MPTSAKADRLEATRKRLIAVTHPTREAIMRVMVDGGEMSPSQVGPLIGETVPNTSHHMKMLLKADCIEHTREGRVRGAVQHFYRAIDRPLVETEDWELFREENPVWAEHLVAQGLQVVLDDAAASARAGLLGADKNTHISRTRLVLDSQGLQEGMEAQERCREEMLEIARRSAERLNREGDNAIHVTSGQLLFEVPTSV
jgi:DNA-binding transcriptional ArsR family regulator